MEASGFTNFNMCCRLCLSEKLDSMTSVFDAPGGDHSLQQKILMSLAVEIHNEDKLSTMICNECIEKVNSWNAYKQRCSENQNKLEQLLHMHHSTEIGDMTIQIKEEPVDREAVCTESVPSGEVRIKSEPMDEDFNEAPPILTPNGIESRPNQVEGMEIEVQGSEEEADPRKCSVCEKMFSSVGNRKKHEKTFHGTKTADPVSESDRASLSQDDVSQSSIDSQNVSLNETAVSEADNEERKILFAAGLKLLQRNSTPPIACESLSKIELSYIEKCKAMASMYNSLECACHNAPHPNLKGLLSHLRSLRIWFPVFTCYHCMITFTDRSSSTRHHAKCARTNLETLVKLSNLRRRSEVKTRLYQNYKCTKCKFMYSFHEDFCTHVDEDHSVVKLPHNCTCGRVFTTVEDYKDHAYVSCLVQFYCDICFITVKTLDAFQKHAAEVHDSSEGFILLQDDNYRRRKPVSLPKPDTPSPTPPPETETPKAVDAEEPPVLGKRRSTYRSPIIEAELEDENDLKVVNPMFKKKVLGTVCPICSKEYSSNNNMLRHYRTHADDYKGDGEEEKEEEEDEAHDDSVYCCPDCVGMFSADEWEKHKETHKEKTCGECGKIFRFQTELDQHRSVHLNLKVYRDSKTDSYKSAMMSPNGESNIVMICEICDAMFTSKEQLKEHKLIHDEMPAIEISLKNPGKPILYECIPCNKQYTGYGGLWDHNRKKHPEFKFAATKEEPRQCKQCNKVFTTGGSYLMHKQMHDRINQKNQNAEDIQKRRAVDIKPSLESSAGSADDEGNDDTESYHTCKRCFKVFSTKGSLRNHMKSHGITLLPSKNNFKTKSSKKVWCDVCHSPFDNLNLLERHKREEHGVKNIDRMPDSADEEMNEAQDLKVPFVFTCDICVQTFNTRIALKKHKDSHIQEKNIMNNRHRVYCKHCKISFENADLLNNHMKDEHMELKHKKPKEKVKQHSCNICRKSFTSATALCAHQGWHKRGGIWKKNIKDEPVVNKVIVNNIVIKEEPMDQEYTYKCSKCPVTMPNDTALQIHILEKHRNVNTTILPARCAMCNLDFNSQDEYDKHKRFHTTVENQPKKSFPCNHCSSAFARIESLNAHIRQNHRNPVKDERKCELKCPQCDRLFDKQASLHIHLKVHEKQRLITGAAPKQILTTTAPPKQMFCCSICNMKFDLPKDLRAHTIQSHPF